MKYNNLIENLRSLKYFICAKFNSLSCGYHKITNWISHRMFTPHLHLYHNSSPIIWGRPSSASSIIIKSGKRHPLLDIGLPQSSAHWPVLGHLHPISSRGLYQAIVPPCKGLTPAECPNAWSKIFLPIRSASYMFPPCVTRILPIFYWF